MELLTIVASIVTIISLPIAIVGVLFGWWLPRRQRKESREKALAAIRASVDTLRQVHIVRPRPELPSPMVRTFQRSQIMQAGKLIQDTSLQHAASLSDVEIKRLVFVTSDFVKWASEGSEEVYFPKGAAAPEDNFFANMISQLFTPDFSWLWNDREGKLTEEESNAARSAARTRAIERDHTDIADEYSDIYTRLYVKYRKDASYDQWTSHWLAISNTHAEISRIYSDKATDWHLNERGEKTRTMSQREVRLSDFAFERGCNIWREPLDF